MIPIRFSKDAAKYARKETEYLRQRNPAAARNFSSAMKSAKRMLQSFPETGNRMHGLQIAGSLTLVPTLSVRLAFICLLFVEWRKKRRRARKSAPPSWLKPSAGDHFAAAGSLR